MTTTMRITTTTTTGSTQRKNRATTTANGSKPRVINLINEQDEVGEGALCVMAGRSERETE